MDKIISMTYINLVERAENTQYRLKVKQVSRNGVKFLWKHSGVSW